VADLPGNETLDELLHAAGDEAAFTDACRREGVYPAVLARLRRGIGTVAHRRTLSRIAAALSVPVERVDAAVRVTRATRNPTW
jgi:hypothetical protein